MRILGLDYGSKTCGVALSDVSEIIASPIETIRYENMDELLNKVGEYINKYNISLIALGNPLNLDGSISKRSEETFLFKNELESKFNVNVELIDERLTTVIANNVLKESGKDAKDRRKVVDKLAASLILSSLLDRRKSGK